MSHGQLFKRIDESDGNAKDTNVSEIHSKVYF